MRFSCNDNGTEDRIDWYRGVFNLVFNMLERLITTVILVVYYSCIGYNLRHFITTNFIDMVVSSSLNVLELLVVSAALCTYR